MKIISPITMTDAILTSSNVPETDYDEWDVSTTYATGDYVISTSSHKVYQSAVSSNLGNDPTTDDGSNWTEISSTNRWKAFDSTISDQVSKSGSITYSISPASLVTGIAFFGLDASEVRVQVFDTESPANEIFDTTTSLVDTGEIVDWFTFFTTDLTDYDTEAQFVGIPAYAGYQIDITVGDGTGTAKVGLIALGRVIEIGKTLDGTSVGITDFSIKEQNDFGILSIVERGFADKTSFQFSLPTDDVRRVKRVLTSLRATPAVYFADEDLTQMGATVFGYYDDFEIPLSAGGVSIATLEIKGLI
ncbi:ACT domain-containing protein [Thiosulfatihalobacter marinus]|uniref:hypothetical protein n=1 Tax=Thiosulfatihalobacter marinus TaxID=2792481 RepID=UPI0018D9915B|nr:hypothetical protein [Thiosulfatihalobacter marinus]